MRSARRTISLVAMCALLALVLCGCLGPRQDTPEAVATAYARAVFRGDVKTARKLADRPNLTMADLDAFKASHGVFGNTDVRTVRVLEVGGTGLTRSMRLGVMLKRPAMETEFPVSLEHRENKWFVNTYADTTPSN